MAVLKPNSLATARADLKSHYAVVIVGSGYGGGVAAARLASTGESVCLLERGKEFHPGEFPENDDEARQQSQLTITREEADADVSGDRTGLYDFHIDHDISIFRGCGLGGTSLLSAGVSLQADPAVFEQPCWPQALVDDVAEGLAAGYTRATDMLTPEIYPDDGVPLVKMQAHQRSAEILEGGFTKLPLNIQFQACRNEFGIQQDACTLCGNCSTGCNIGASNTVAMNYLPAAQQYGAEIFTEMEVRRVERTFDGRQWRVYYFPQVSDKSFYDQADELYITTDCIVLSAGSIGTTEILLRSKNHGLSVSRQLGKSFSGNADLLGFGYNGDERIHAVGSDQQDGLEPVGPAVTCAIDMRGKASLQDQYIIEDAVLPGAFANLYAAALSTAEPLIRKNSGTKGKDFLKEKWRKAESVFRGAHFGAVAHTQIFHLTGHDSAAGEIQLQNDQLQIEWSGVSAENVFENFNEVLNRLSEANGGVYLQNPSWNSQLNSRLMTFQPLGGCAMAEDASKGVTNHRGQVYSEKQGAEIHVGLYVADGALMPMSLGIPPLLTITALAERNMVLLAAEYGWTIGKLPLDGHSDDDGETKENAAASEHSAVPELNLPVLNSTETATGFWSPESGEHSDHDVAFNAGKDNHHSVELVMTIDERDAGDESVEVTFSGTAQIPALSDDALQVSQGSVHTSSDEAEKSRIVYRAVLFDDTGGKWQFDGYSLATGNDAEEAAVDTENATENGIYFSISLLQAGEGDHKAEFVGKGIVSF